MKVRPRIDRDRLSILLGGVGVCLILSRISQLPTQRYGIQALGSQLGVELSTHWFMTALAVGLVVAQGRLVLLDHPLCRGGQAFVFSILPALTALVVGALLSRMEGFQSWLLTMVAGMVVLGVVTTSEFRSLEPSELVRPGARLLAATLVYAIALILLTLISTAGLRALLAGPAVFVVTSLLTVRFLWSTEHRSGRVALYSGIIGLVMAQVIWALNYWRISPVSSGLLLLMIFYVATGTVQQSLRGLMSRRVLVEHGVVAVATMAVILSLNP
jgi:hypothetical protein